MANLIDYLNLRGDVTFEYSDFNAVDALILTTITYINYPDADYNRISLKEGYNKWIKLPGDEKFRGLSVMREKTEELAELMAGSKRYSDLRLTRYVEVTSDLEEEQFSAMTFILPDNYVFIAYRGTDNSIVGWKDSFNIAATDGTSSQLEAANYANKIAEEFPDAKLLIGGHSKGGNLAGWAAMHLQDGAKSRLKRVYCYDSPGFSKKVFESEEYNSVKNMILSFVPDSSIVGILMFNPPQLVVKSDADGFMQHDQFSWRVMRRGFEYLTERTFISRHLEKSIDKIVANLNQEEYMKFIGKIYDDIRDTEDIVKNIENFIHKK